MIFRAPFPHVLFSVWYNAGIYGMQPACLPGTFTL